MRKPRLDPESLRVESFAVPAPAAGRGTVRAHSGKAPTFDWNQYTCGVSCVGPCQHTLEVPGCGVNTDFGCV